MISGCGSGASNSLCEILDMNLAKVPNLRKVLWLKIHGSITLQESKVINRISKNLLVIFILVLVSGAVLLVARNVDFKALTRDIFQARIVSALRTLNRDRQEVLVQFLHNSTTLEFVLKGADLSGLDLHTMGLFKADLRGANLEGADLSFAYLTGGNLSEANLRRAILTGAFMGGIDLVGADLREANLNQAYLYGSDLSGANISGAHLSGANLREAVLAGADLNGSNLSRAYLFGANLMAATLVQADLSKTDLSEANLEGADLTEANLEDANLSEADFSKANLQGANLRNVFLPNANLDEVNLTGADLGGAYLKGAKNLTNTQLADAITLAGVTLPDGEKYDPAVHTDLAEMRRMAGREP